MTKNCFVYETLGAVNEMQMNKTNDGFMHLKGTFGVCGVKNNNSRIYEAGNYGRMVDIMKQRIVEAQKKAKPGVIGGIPGELEHPQSMNITLENISHKITDIKIDENGVVSGEIVLLNTPKGKIAQAIVEGGLPLFISSRATGSVDPKTCVVTLENLATYDLVGSPGFSQAELSLNEGQVAEALCESCGYVYTKETNENNEDMDNKEILERLEALETRVAEQETTISTLREENDALKEQVSVHENVDIKALCDGIQKWVLEEVAPEIQNYMVECFAPEVQNWVVEHFAPEVEKWVVEQFAPEVQKWVVEQYSPEVQKWCQNEFAEGIQNWFVEECAPEFQNWVTEHYGAEVANKIEEAVKNSKKNSLSNIESTLSMLESIQPAKPTYPGVPAKTLINEDANQAKYITEMPADARVKYDLASQEIKEAIDRRARLFDFNHHTINEFWEGVNFEQIVPAQQPSFSTVNEAEKDIRLKLRSWKMSRGF